MANSEWRMRLYQLAMTIFQVQYGHHRGHADWSKSYREHLSRLLEQIMI